MASYRRERVQDLLLGFLANEVQRLTDPRLDLVTVTAVDISPDLKNAWIYWTCPGEVAHTAAGAAVEGQPTAGEGAQSAAAHQGGATAAEVKPAGGSSSAQSLAAERAELERTFPSDARKEEVEDALRGASGFLRRRIADELELRYIPALSFRYDSSAANASRIDFLLKKAGF